LTSANGSGDIQVSLDGRPIPTISPSATAKASVRTDGVGRTAKSLIQENAEREKLDPRRHATAYAPICSSSSIAFLSSAAVLLMPASGLAA